MLLHIPTLSESIKLVLKEGSGAVYITAVVGTENHSATATKPATTTVDTRYPMDDDSIDKWLADKLQLHQRLETGELLFTRTADKRDPSATACPSPTTSSLDSISMCDPMDDDRYWLTLSWLTSRGL